MQEEIFSLPKSDDVCHLYYTYLYFVNIFDITLVSTYSIHGLFGILIHLNFFSKNLPHLSPRIPMWMPGGTTRRSAGHSLGQRVGHGAGLRSFFFHSCEKCLLSGTLLGKAVLSQ